MTAREALRATVRECAQAGIEYAADILRAEGIHDAADLLWERRHVLAEHLAEMDDEPGYESTDAMRVLRELCAKTDGPA
jgi:hypothetical protein